MVYQQILPNGEKYGSYSIKKSPKQVSEAIAKEIYDGQSMQGNKILTVHFCKNKPYKEYMYRVSVKPLKHPIATNVKNGVLTFGTQPIYKVFEIKSEKI